jgi:hypothetical protein
MVNRRLFVEQRLIVNRRLIVERRLIDKRRFGRLFGMDRAEAQCWLFARPSSLTLRVCVLRNTSPKR